MKLLNKNKKVLTRTMESFADKESPQPKKTREFSADFPDCKNFQIGPCAFYILDFKNNKFLHMDDRIEQITGIPANEYLNRKPAETIGEVADPAHIEAIAEYINKTMELLDESSSGDEMIASIEHNVITRDGQPKRIISQFYPVVFNDMGRPAINKGRVIDITHIRNDGLPRMFVMKNNRIIYEETAQPESVIRGGDINLTKTEIELIRLLSEGNTSQQIAEKMNISILTVYTHRKNIRNKTHQEMNRLISVLKDKGILK